MSDHPSKHKGTGATSCPDIAGAALPLGPRRDQATYAADQAQAEPEKAIALVPKSEDRFKLRIVFHPEEGGYWVEVPGFPGCVSEGDTKEEALLNIREAFLGMLEAMQNRGPKEAGQVEEIDL